MEKILTVLAYLCLFIPTMACGDSVDAEPLKETESTNGEQKATLQLTYKDEWRIDTISQGYIYYIYNRYDMLSDARQIVNVLEIDLTNPKYKLELAYYDRVQMPTLSVVSKEHKGTIGGINGGYEPEAIYIKQNGNIISPIALNEGHLRFWKHEGAICFSNSDTKIIFPGKAEEDVMIRGRLAKQVYEKSDAENILASAPVLIDDYDQVGEIFVPENLTSEQLDALDYEDYRRHQGVRHPRTIVALTENKKLLFITIDGRHTGKAEGMTAKEMTQFINKYFKPQYALNLDGGGSTAMYVKGHGDAITNIVNYPCDNNKFDHSGERNVTTFLLIKEVQ